MIKDFSKDSGAIFEGAFEKLKGGLALFGVSFGAEKMFEGIRAAGELAEKIDALSETFGTSTKFLQSWEYAAGKANSSAEMADKGMKKLVETIGKAREGDAESVAKLEKHGIALSDLGGNALSTESIFESVRQHILDTDDATVSAARAAELFGDKIGSKLVPALREWQELQKKAESKILSTAELDILHTAGEDIKDMESTFKRVSAKVAAITLDIFSWKSAVSDAMKARLLAPDKAPGETSKTEKQIKEAKEYAKALADRDAAYQKGSISDPFLKALEEKMQAQKAFDAAANGSIEKLKTEKTLIEKTSEVEKERANIRKKSDQDKHKSAEDAKRAAEHEKEDQQRILELQVRITNHRAAIDKSKKNYAEGFADRSKFSLGELADQGREKWKASQGETWAEMRAVDIQNMEENAKQQRNFGNTGRAEFLTKRALEMRKSMGDILKTDDSDPMKGLREEFEKSSKAMEELLMLAKGKGFQIATDDKP